MKRNTLALAGLAALMTAAAPAFAAAAQDGAQKPAAAAAKDAKSEAVAEAEAFTKELTAKATEALTDAALSREAQLEKFQTVLAEGLALDVIGKFMLGDKRKTMSAEQIARYDAAFPDYITKLYAEQFDEIVGRPLEVIDARAVNSRDIIIRTQFKRESGSPIMVDWRVRKLKDGGHKMIDIIVSGVSIMLVKREEFSAFVSTHGVDALLDRLEEEAKAQAS